MAKILIVEDDLVLSDMLVSWLRRDHHLVETSIDGVEALDRLLFGGYDLAVIDWDLPGQTGVTAIRKYREAGGKAPVLMLTGKSSVEDKQTGFNAGTDDYLTKPFHTLEFQMRVKALLRRASENYDDILRVGILEVEPTKFIARVNGVILNLRPAEFRLLEFLMRNPNRVFSAETLLERVWSTEREASTESVRMCIARLRSKLLDASEMLKTISGVGYSLQA